MNVNDEAALLKLAEAEILGEAKRATVRHSIAGPSGWKPVPKTNKSFLINTLLQTISSNKTLSNKHRSGKDLKKSERKLLQIDRRQGTICNIGFKKPNKNKTVKDKSKQDKCKNEKKKTGKHSSKSKNKVKN